MRQVVPKKINGVSIKKKRYKPMKVKSSFSKNKNNVKYGISKLEFDFAKDFLDKLGLVYIYQYEAKEIGRYYDFAVTAYDTLDYRMEEKDGITCVQQEGQSFIVSFIIEVDGDYFHANPEKFKVKDLTPTQKRNLRIDKQKNRYLALKGIPLVRLWENDIRNNPKKVIEEIKKHLSDAQKKKLIKENRKHPH